MSIITDLFDLNGRTALVTGGSSGLGAEMGRCLAAAGARVVLLGRRKDKLVAECQKISEAGGRASFIDIDLTRPDAIEATQKRLDAQQAHIDILVNSAGINLRKSADQVTREDWNRTIELNLGVPFFLAQALQPFMAQQSWGRIINIGSLQSVRAFPDSIPYGVSKGGVVQLTRAMAQAWSGQGINCNAIAPGLFPTELTSELFADPDLIRQMAAQTCVQRNAELQDIGGVTLFLASHASVFVTGQTIFVDGGYTAK